jgi:hypothetical protein
MKPIQVNHYRKENPLVFGNTEGTEHTIEGFLPIGGKYLNPASVANSHNIGVVTPDA